MRKRRFTALMLCLMLLLPLFGCVMEEEQEAEGLKLYGMAAEETRAGGDVIEAVTVPWDQLPTTREDQLTAVLDLLLTSREDYRSPFPEGTVINNAFFSGSTACIDLGGGYHRLSGMARTVADYCLTLSLTQLTGVYAVRVTADGREENYRKQMMLSGDVLLSSMDDVVRTLTATLYFPDETGALVGEERLLTQYEGESAAQVVLQALSDGAENEELLPLLPENFVGMTARMEEGVCHLNIPADSMALLGETEEQTVQAIADSLRSVEGIREVQLYTDGQPQGAIN